MPRGCMMRLLYTVSCRVQQKRACAACESELVQLAKESLCCLCCLDAGAKGKAPTHDYVLCAGRNERGLTPFKAGAVGSGHETATAAKGAKGAEEAAQGTTAAEATVWAAARAAAARAATAAAAAARAAGSRAAAGAAAARAATAAAAAVAGTAATRAAAVAGTAAASARAPCPCCCEMRK